MAYDRSRVTLTEDQHVAAKEWNDLIEAIIDQEGDIAKESLEAVMASTSLISGDKRARLQFVIKVLLANIMDESQQRLLGAGP